MLISSHNTPYIKTRSSCIFEDDIVNDAFLSNKRRVFISLRLNRKLKLGDKCSAELLRGAMVNSDYFVGRHIGIALPNSYAGIGINITCYFHVLNPIVKPNIR